MLRRWLFDIGLSPEREPLELSALKATREKSCPRCIIDSTISLAGQRAVSGHGAAEICKLWRFSTMLWLQQLEVTGTDMSNVQSKRLYRS